MTEGLSSHGASRKRFGGATVDRSAYTAGQALVTVVNDPRADAAKNWGAWLGFRVPDVSWQDPPPPIDTMRYPPVTRRDLAKYLALVADGSFEQFQQTRQSLALGGISQQFMSFEGDAADLDDYDPSSYDIGYKGYSLEGPAAALDEPNPFAEGADSHSRRSNAGPPGEPSLTPHSVQRNPAVPRLAQGDGLVTALQVVPPLFFNEDFSLSRPDIFEAICGCEDDNEMYARIDKLNAALDVVETQLMREIASRSRAIVAAGNCVHDLHNRLSNTLTHIKRLRENVSDMDDVTYSAAVHVAQLQRRRNNLTATVERVQSLEEVAAAKAALPLLLDSGDYAEFPVDVGRDPIPPWGLARCALLECLPQFGGCDLFGSKLFICLCRELNVGCGALELLDNLSHAATGLSSSGVAAFRGLPPQLAESRLVVESLLQAEMLGAAMYTEAHLVLERAVAESAQELGLAAAAAPLALSPSDSNGITGGPLTSSSVSGSEATVMSREASLRSAGSSSLLAAELAAAREQLHDRLLPVVLGLHRCARLEAALRQFAVNRAAEVKAIVREVVERLLPILMVITSMVEAYLAHTLLVGTLVEDALRGGRAPAAALVTPKREVHSALQAVVDVATGSRLKVYEFRALLSACEAFAALPDMHGLRPGAALRPTLQALCRAHLENTHSRCAMQMQHLLEAEQWVPAEAHASFQAIVDRLEDRCPGARPQSPQQQLQEGDEMAQQQRREGQEQAKAASGAADGKLEGQRPTQGLLRLGGRHYWPVNALLMLLKLLDEHYMGLLPASPPPTAATAAALTAAAEAVSGAGTATLRRWGAVAGQAPSQAASWALSTVGPDVAQRCMELLRSFNTVTAQQVLGAGAMRTAGLKSISAKHLALAAQSLAALLAVLPLLRWQLAAAIAEAPRRALLMPEFDRLAQDLNLHVEEIHGKLVDIMQDRVLAACRQISADSDAWGRAAASLQAQQAAQPVPSEALRLLARQLGTLRSVLQPILQPEEVSYIFGRVAAACSESLAGLLDSLTPPTVVPSPSAPLPSGASGLLRGLGSSGAAATAAATAAVEAQALATAAWEASRRANALFMLQALLSLPLDSSRSSSYVTRLTTFYTKHYGLLPTDGQARPVPAGSAGLGGAPAAAANPTTAPPGPAAAGELPAAVTVPVSVLQSPASVSIVATGASPDARLAPPPVAPARHPDTAACVGPPPLAVPMVPAGTAVVAAATPATTSGYGGRDVSDDMQRLSTESGEPFSAAIRNASDSDAASSSVTLLSSKVPAILMSPPPQQQQEQPPPVERRRSLQDGGSSVPARNDAINGPKPGDGDDRSATGEQVQSQSVEGDADCQHRAAAAAADSGAAAAAAAPATERAASLAVDAVAQVEGFADGTMVGLTTESEAAAASLVIGSGEALVEPRASTSNVQGAAVAAREEAALTGTGAQDALSLPSTSTPVAGAALPMTMTGAEALDAEASSAGEEQEPQPPSPLQPQEQQEYGTTSAEPPARTTGTQAPAAVRVPDVTTAPMVLLDPLGGLEVGRR
ncbi:hypothetical protein VOLCADRAFT_107628 [Volvox carteri f. nagariensis]|uniref:Vacuolar protein sorting-associated protein 54 C-terminal domain-containing protein n=1 Tax=Volvox carteri f. nagariensis TaxID=3068 RepID=D8UFA0_VOLCA|nr:uncharacterized protein VOLCADRAFT_107628 [Volvox carteri f. nagariensis]EFJ41568.1 hypothetical protein VOLCADRAFT_107628 [Volvox carteri f. nagariensis]|eukprot:XP_002957359.1 hypothetical protein VOLCADRAFT_107628 [Volvox carteri f. nagariensis]